MERISEDVTTSCVWFWLPAISPQDANGYAGCMVTQRVTDPHSGVHRCMRDRAQRGRGGRDRRRHGIAAKMAKQGGFQRITFGSSRPGWASGPDASATYEIPIEAKRMSSGGGKDHDLHDGKPSGPAGVGDSSLSGVDLASVGNFINQPYQPCTTGAAGGCCGHDEPVCVERLRRPAGPVADRRHYGRRTPEGIAPNLMAQFNAGGAYGGSAHLQALQNSQDAFAHQLAEASTGIRAQNADGATRGGTR